VKLSLTIRLPTSNEYSLELDLARAVVPEQSQVKILSSRVLVIVFSFPLLAVLRNFVGHFLRFLNDDAYLC